MSKESYVTSLVDSYLNDLSFYIKENSNNSKAYPSLRSYLANSVMSKYALTKMYPKHIADAHKQGAIHIHDLGHPNTIYCCGFDLEMLLMEGFNGIAGRSNSAPPKHLRTACHQIVNFIGTLQSYLAGAIAFNNVDTLLAPYVKKDKLTYDEIKQCIQELVFGLNIPSRSGEVPFSNFSFDLVCPRDMMKKPIYIGGEIQNFGYGDCSEEIKLIGKAFFEVFLEGDCNQRTHSFPIPTINVTKDFDWDCETADLLFDLTAKYGSPYFSNFVNSDLEPESVRSMCPLAGDTQVFVKVNGDECLLSLKELYNKQQQDPTIQYQTKYKDWWYKATPTSQGQQKIIKVKTSFGLEIKFGEFHLQPTSDSFYKCAKDLKLGDLLPVYYSEREIQYQTEYKDWWCNDLTTSQKNQKAIGDLLPVYSERDLYGLKYVQITEIEELPPEEVFCFQVDLGQDVGAPLFQLSNGLITHNCRLRIDMAELHRKGGGTFGSGSSTGSIGVVTINLPQLAIKNKGLTEDDLYKELDKVLDIAIESLTIKRNEINKMFAKGLFPYIERWLPHGTSRHFNTIGIIGMNELLKLVNMELHTPEGLELAQNILDFILRKIQKEQETSGVLYNLEETPAEGASSRFAEADGSIFPFYTQGAKLPFDYSDNLIDKLDKEEPLLTKYTGGSACHIFLSEKCTREQAKFLIRSVVTNYKIPYLTLSPTFSICSKHGYIDGETTKCPECGETTEIFSRVVGYYSPLSRWHEAKKKEFEIRKTFVVAS